MSNSLFDYGDYDLNDDIDNIDNEDSELAAAIKASLESYNSSQQHIPIYDNSSNHVDLTSSPPPAASGKKKISTIETSSSKKQQIEDQRNIKQNFYAQIEAAVDEGDYDYEYNQEEGEGDNDENYAYSDHDDEEDEVKSDDSGDDSHGHHAHDRNTSEEDESFVVPDSSYRIVDYSEVSPLMETLANEIVKLLAVSYDDSIILLKSFSWSKERLLEAYLLNSINVMKQCQLIPSSTQDLDKNSKYCGICMMDADSEDEIRHLPCGHRFCVDCYKGYIKSKIGEGAECASMHCPQHKCLYPLPLSFIKELAVSADFERYFMFLIRNFIEKSKPMCWCPSSGCNRVAIGSNITTVKCLCKNAFCFKCGEQAHDPASCEIVSKWNDVCKSDSNTFDWILANTKRCPKCAVSIEKNMGCQHMTCKMCRHEFCWVCMGNWLNHNSCNRYVEQNNVSAAKNNLARYLHCYERYVGHDSSLKFASKQRHQAEEEVMNRSQFSAYDNELYLLHAVEMVISCRLALKYTYVLAFFMKDNTAEKQLFEYQQEMLEGNTEKLSGLTEKVGYDGAHRNDILNLTKVTENFLKSLIDSMSEFNDAALNESKQKQSAEKESDYGKDAKKVTATKKKGKR